MQSVPVAGDAGPQAPNLFQEAAADKAAAEAQRQEDRQLALLIGAKNVERLRVFGWAVTRVADSLPPATTDGRSLERS